VLATPWSRTTFLVASLPQSVILKLGERPRKSRTGDGYQVVGDVHPELLAIDEFNDENTDVKIDRWRGVQRYCVFPTTYWLSCPKIGVSASRYPSGNRTASTCRDDRDSHRRIRDEACEVFRQRAVFKPARISGKFSQKPLEIVLVRRYPARMCQCFIGTRYGTTNSWQGQGIGNNSCSPDRIGVRVVDNNQ